MPKRDLISQKALRKALVGVNSSEKLGWSSY